MYFKRVSQDNVMVKVFPQMKPRVGIPHRRVIEINYVNGYDIRQFPVILPFFQASRVFPAPIKEAAAIHVVLVADLLSH
jgi:hypothetical protein